MPSWEQRNNNPTPTGTESRSLKTINQRGRQGNELLKMIVGRQGSQAGVTEKKIGKYCKNNNKKTRSCVKVDVAGLRVWISLRVLTVSVGVRQH